MTTVKLLPDWKETPIVAPFQPLRNGELSDMITHCKVCRLPRADDWPLNDSGYCELCYTHIPERFRTAPGRGREENRMSNAVRRAAKRLGRELRVPHLYWSEERNTWLWSLRTARSVWTKDERCVRA